jgi:broad specificity phosphatase PhoE
LTHKLILVRHGVTSWNKVKRFQGHQDVMLDDEGLTQAINTAQALKHQKINRIYTSDLIRAKQTAFEIKRYQSEALLIESPILREGYGGELEGKIFGKKNWASEVQSLNSLRTFMKHSGETVEQIKARITNFIFSIFEQLPDEPQNIVVVSHGGPIRMFLGHILDLDDETAIIQKISNCSISTLTYNGKSFQLNELNKIDHLQYIKI